MPRRDAAGRFARVIIECMKNSEALRRADELVKAFVESQDIPPGGTSGTAADHGAKTAQFIAAIHRGLYEYFLGLDEG
jgi:hypothetical protein